MTEGGLEATGSILVGTEDYVLSDNVDSESEEEQGYDDTVRIQDFPYSFNLRDDNSKPDTRNVKYKTATDHLNCPICQQPFLDPVTTSCGHTFCKECIHECFKAAKGNRNGELKGTCPLDRTPLDASDSNSLFATPIVISNLIDDLQVFCLNEERGCEWTGSRWELEHHLLYCCGYTGVPCNGVRRRSSRKGRKDSLLDQEFSATNTSTCDEGDLCRLLVERRFLLEEDDKCVHKKYSCNFCSAMVTKVTEEKHLNSECLYNYTTCDLCLNDIIPLKNLSKHKANCKQIKHIRCPAHEIGCNWVGNNEMALEIHLQKNNCQLNQALPHFKEMKDKVSSLEEENAFIQKQINKILDLVIQGKITNLGHYDNVEEIHRTDALDNEDKLIYLNYEMGRLKFELEEVILPFIKQHTRTWNEREGVMNNLANDNLMMKEDLGVQRALINSLRKQMHILLFRRYPRFLNPTSTSNLSSSIDDDSLFRLDSLSRSNSDERLNLKL